MFFFSSRRLATVLVVLVARSHGFVVPRPTLSRAFGIRLFSTNNDEVASMRVGDIKKELESYGISTKSFLEKSELIDALNKARADGLKPKETSVATENSSTSSGDREERLKEELEKCNAMKASELKKELQELRVSTKSFFEKSEFAKALAEARVDAVKKSSASSGEEGYAEYANVEVITDDSTGPRQKQSQRQSESSSPFGRGGSPFGNASGRNTPDGANPFGSMGGMGGLADMLKNLGGVGGAGGGDPFGGANPFAGGGSPFGGMGGGMGDVMGKAQEMMKNPKVMEIIAKAQSNPRVMKAVQECMSNPAAMAKYQNDPEISSLLNELKKYM